MARTVSAILHHAPLQEVGAHRAGALAELRARSLRVDLPGLIEEGTYFHARADLAHVVDTVGVIRFVDGATRAWHWHRLPEGNSFILYARGVRPEGEFSRLLVVGPRSLAHVDPVVDAEVIVAARVHPGMTAGVFRTDARHLLDDAVDADALWGAAARAFQRRLDDARADADLALTLEQTLAETFAASRSWDLLGRRAAGIVLAHQGALRLDELERKVGYSRRHLRRRFEESVGISPKRFGRIARFRAAIDRLGRAARPDWRRLAADLDYYDQSHMIADFREFTGFTPTDLLGHERFDAVLRHATILRPRARADSPGDAGHRPP
jgi:AraC-like DNA-binding protein